MFKTGDRDEERVEVHVDYCGVQGSGFNLVPGLAFRVRVVSLDDGSEILYLGDDYSFTYAP